MPATNNIASANEVLPLPPCPIRATFRIFSGTIRPPGGTDIADHRKDATRRAVRVGICRGCVPRGLIWYFDGLVIDTRVRPRLQGIIGPIGKFLVAAGVSPAVMT